MERKYDFGIWEKDKLMEWVFDMMEMIHAMKETRFRGEEQENGACIDPEGPERGPH